MALTGVLRPGFAQIRVTNMDAAIKHYGDRVGLNEVSREPDGRVYLRAFDEFDRHCLVLRTADQPGVDRVAFKVAREADLGHFVERIKAAGLAVEDIPAGEQPGVGWRISFTVPSGHTMRPLRGDGPVTARPDDRKP